MSDLTDLYQEVILDHNKRPRNYGTLADAPTLRPTAHLYVGSKAPWFTITDDLPQHEEL